MFEISLLFSRRTDDVHKNLISPIIASVSGYVCRFRVDLPYDASRRCFEQFLVSGAVLMLVSQLHFKHNFFDRYEINVCITKTSVWLYLLYIYKIQVYLFKRKVHVTAVYK